MEEYLQAYYRFEQDNWVRWLPMAEFAHKNSWPASTIISPFEALLGCHPQWSYEDNRDSRSNSRAADEEATDLRNLMRGLKTNLAKPK